MISKLKYIIPAIYLLGGILVWIQFRGSPPDGLSNIGIVLYVLPMTMLGMLIFGKNFPFFSGSYYVSHFRFFSLSLLVMTGLIFFVCLLIGRITLGKRK
jgi:hypothetical protein